MLKKIQSISIQGKGTLDWENGYKIHVSVDILTNDLNNTKKYRGSSNFVVNQKLTRINEFLFQLLKKRNTIDDTFQGRVSPISLIPLSHQSLYIF